MDNSHFEQAKMWLEGARHIASSAAKERYAVAIAMAIHAIIKANDALTIKFLNTTARRHDDARRLFEDMVKQNFIIGEYAGYKQIIQYAINEKAKAEYRGLFFSKKDFEEMERKAEKFLKMVERMI